MNNKRQHILNSISDFHSLMNLKKPTNPLVRIVKIDDINPEASVGLESLAEIVRKKQVSDYIVTNKFDFNVLLDTRKSPDYNVVTAYKVDGLPTKFVISPDGQIAFKDVGYAGSDEKLINDLSAMIELAR